MRRLLAGVLLSVFFALACPSLTRAGASDEALVRLLIKKGLLTQEEYEALKKEAEVPPASPTAQPPPAPLPGAVALPPSAAQEPDGTALVDRLRDEVREELRRRDIESVGVGLKLESETRFRSHRDIGDRDRGSSSETYLRAAEVDLAVRPLPWVLASLVVKSEYFGADTTNLGQAADATPFIDEGTITLQDASFPVYGVVGKRTQPFGAFFGDERWATEPITKDAYEVDQPGLTLGVFRWFPDTGFEFDVSVTVYRQEEQMSHLFESGLFDATTVTRSSTAGLRAESDHLKSFILVGTLTPNRFFTLGAAYLTEPGDGRRNQSLAAWVSRTWFGRLTTELEFMAALDRERYVRPVTLADGTVETQRFSRAFEEKALALSITYQPWRRFLLGGRFEYFWDDGLAEAAGIWSVRDRASLAASYTFFERDEISVRIIGEYRHSDIRREGAARDAAASDQNELFGKVSVVYK